MIDYTKPTVTRVSLVKALANTRVNYVKRGLEVSRTHHVMYGDLPVRVDYVRRFTI